MVDSTLHHCLERKKGNCRLAYTPSQKNPYCKVHMSYCLKKECGEHPFSPGRQECTRCGGEKKAAAKKAEEARKAALAEKKRKEEEKKAAEKARQAHAAQRHKNGNKPEAKK
ncbi:hypothetical protein DL98DRAFT_535723 [Cadophora sp. DSE1049]|nr:hypothetical protein DL98DRAFT_535723 [Cadophora sp. DSE1049]